MFVCSNNSDNRTNLKGIKKAAGDEIEYKDQHNCLLGEGEFAENVEFHLNTNKDLELCFRIFKKLALNSFMTKSNTETILSQFHGHRQTF